MGLQTVTLAHRKLAAVIEFANFVNGFCVLVVILQLFNRDPIAVCYWRRKRGYLCTISPYNPPKQIVLGGNDVAHCCIAAYPDDRLRIVRPDQSHPYHVTSLMLSGCE